MLPVRLAHCVQRRRVRHVALLEMLLVVGRADRPIAVAREAMRPSFIAYSSG